MSNERAEPTCPDCGASMLPDQNGIICMGHGEHYEDCLRFDTPTPRQLRDTANGPWEE